MYESVRFGSVHVRKRKERFSGSSWLTPSIKTCEGIGHDRSRRGPRGLRALAAAAMLATRVGGAHVLFQRPKLAVLG